MQLPKTIIVGPFNYTGSSKSYWSEQAKAGIAYPWDRRIEIALPAYIKKAAKRIEAEIEAAQVKN